MKIVVSVGHTLEGLGSGAIGHLNESKENRIVSNLVRKYLEQQGHQVVFLQIDKSPSKGYDYHTRVDMANKESNVDLFAEIHFNSSASGTARGTEVYAKSTKGREYAQKVVNSIVSLGFINRGVKDGSGLYVINQTNAPAILIECCFVNGTDYMIYDADKMAKAIVKGITGQEVNLIIKEEENMLDKIVVFSNDKDRRAGEYLADFLGCPTVYKDSFNSIQKMVKEEGVHVVGGNWKPSAKAKLISGSDRYATCLEVFKFMGKI